MKTDRGTALVIIDMHNDFTDGSPACRHTEESVSRAVSFIDKATAGQHGDEAEILDTFPILFVGGRMAHEAEMPDPLKPYVSEELSFNTENGKLSVADAANTAGQSLSEVLELLDINDVYICCIDSGQYANQAIGDLKKPGFNGIILTDACIATGF